MSEAIAKKGKRGVAPVRCKNKYIMIKPIKFPERAVEVAPVSICPSSSAKGCGEKPPPRPPSGNSGCFLVLRQERRGKNDQSFHVPLIKSAAWLLPSIPRSIPFCKWSLPGAAAAEAQRDAFSGHDCVSERVRFRGETLLTRIKGRAAWGLKKEDREKKGKGKSGEGWEESGDGGGGARRSDRSVGTCVIWVCDVILQPAPGAVQAASRAEATQSASVSSSSAVCYSRSPNTSHPPTPGSLFPSFRPPSILLSLLQSRGAALPRVFCWRKTYQWKLTTRCRPI